ncbi:MAG TPA: Hsp20/alpha crystallin family protein [Candidatus Hydrogenedentes bacterium]|nr:Hsp20/alpha crystallin family protein [Candidatus Hydrogenedentota bacterium]HRT19198.1 Hsp20/alpha crystallin family protein [Candidatus Hydrogenedentota bacterium]HRT66421.1 Hsp20/alpha crystallin family protein [Candidatus Hydrogenedentota bacterium]
MSNLIPTTWKDSVEQLRGNVLDLFDRWMPPMLRRDREQSPSLWPYNLFSQGGPAVEVTEDAESVHVNAEMPGLDEKDFSVEIQNDRLVLRGEKKASHEEKRRDYHFSECTYGAFTRCIPLPCEVDADKASAVYRKGILAITLPKTPESKARRIKVEVA